MKFSETPLTGAFVIDIEPASDERGFFARTFCAREFAAHGLPTAFVQASVSFSRARGTMRGMHYQVSPALEAKLVRCTRGKIHDVIIDLRPDSETYLQHFAVELSAENRRALFIPALMAHGFLTLEPDTEVTYMMDEFFAPGQARGVRYNDPRFDIRWPAPIEVISAKDEAWPDFDAKARHE